MLDLLLNGWKPVNNLNLARRGGSKVLISCVPLGEGIIFIFLKTSVAACLGPPVPSSVPAWGRHMGQQLFLSEKPS